MQSVKICANRIRESLGVTAFLIANGKVEFLGEIFDGFLKSQVFNLLNEGNRISLLARTETIEKAFFRMDVIIALAKFFL